MGLLAIGMALCLTHPAQAADVDELLRTGDWLHGPPEPEKPPEPLYAYA